MVKLHVAINNIEPNEEMRDWLLESSVARARQEHEALKEELRSIYDQACNVRNDREEKRLNREIRQLHDCVKLFMKHWAAHTKWEDSELYPQAATYLGAEPDLFMLMEQEYELADQYLRTFMRSLEKAEYPIVREEACKMTSYLIQAYAVLNNRFREEDEIMLDLTDRSNAYGF
ncbi:hemerythrin domain-containing protein [Cohnella sp.]|uniref:hemerythrin domain-containing protein n=1 Tax=Cohnella sp. TaxID=1883426 RepID=UPI00356554C9